MREAATWREKSKRKSVFIGSIAGRVVQRILRVCASLPHNLTAFLAENISGVIRLLSLREAYISLLGVPSVFLSVIRLAYRAGP